MNLYHLCQEGFCTDPSFLPASKLHRLLEPLLVHCLLDLLSLRKTQSLMRSVIRTRAACEEGNLHNKTTPNTCLFLPCGIYQPWLPGPGPTISTHSIRGSRTDWLPHSETTQAGVLAVVSRRARTASTPIRLAWAQSNTGLSSNRTLQRHQDTDGA